MRPRLAPGPVIRENQTEFRVWACGAKSVELVLPSRGNETVAMQALAEGTFSVACPGVGDGDRYWFRLNGNGPFPDPASRYQPDGVHGASQLVDLHAYRWKNKAPEIDPNKLVLYELHTGTFTPEGTFRSLRRQLPYLKDLGVTGVELMPVADFAGSRNWGYDGVSLFAPARCYGTPRDLQELIDEAHGMGLWMFLDVVYNHLGPDGAYHGLFCPKYYTDKHRTPWGAALNFDDQSSDIVRDFFIGNAIQWLREYRFDGLRLDAVHAIIDDSPVNFLAELAARVRTEVPGRRLIIAEDTRNLRYMLSPPEEDGYGLDGVWSDDFHHEMRRCVAGDSDGYFQDYKGTAESVAATARKGWIFEGQHSPYFGHERGTPADGLSLDHFVFCIQNHDQVGNRAFGDRLHHQIDMASYRAASAFLLLLPEVPMLFMGQEWAASTPFLYFTDHTPELGQLVTDGRRKEFSRFAAFADPAARERIPDPQAANTFEESLLRWKELDDSPHREIMALYKAMLQVRQGEAAMQGIEFRVQATSSDALIVERRSDGAALVAIVLLRKPGPATAIVSLGDIGASSLQTVLSTEDECFALDPQPIRLDKQTGTVSFARPGAILFRMGELS